MPKSEKGDKYSQQIAKCLEILTTEQGCSSREMKQGGFEQYAVFFALPVLAQSFNKTILTFKIW